MNDGQIYSRNVPSTYVVEQISNIDNIAAGFNLYGDLVYYGENRYMILSTNPISKGINPIELIKKIERDPNLFYLNTFAIEITNDNYVSAFDKAMDYCQDAAFLKRLYNEYNMKKLPECIRYAELTGLKNWAEYRFNENAPDSLREASAKGLKIFFKKEKAILGQEKRKFFRTSRYDEKFSSIQKKKDYDNRDGSIIRLDVLIESSTWICKKIIGKNEFERLHHGLKENFPDVLFSKSEEKRIPLALFPELSQSGIPYTEALADNWVYFEIYYKKVDEDYILNILEGLYPSEDVRLSLDFLQNYLEEKLSLELDKKISSAAPVISFTDLLDTSPEIGKHTVEKSELEDFYKYLTSTYPNVPIALSAVDIVDTGLIEFARNNPNHPMLSPKPVTNAEFRAVIRERFATEGFECVNNIRPAYWEYYDVFYKKTDEQKIAVVYNRRYLEFARANRLSEIKTRGPLEIIDIPIDEIHGFVEFAKSYELPFYFDTEGTFDVPSFTDIQVVYSSADRDLMDFVVNNLLYQKITASDCLSRQGIRDTSIERRVDLACY